MRNLLLLIFSMFSSTAFALNSAHFTINRITAPYFVVDGNQPATLNKAYVGFEIINNSNSGTTYSGLVFTITSVTTNVVGQNYALLSPVSGQQLIGTLAPGQSKVCYYYVSYPASTSPSGTFNVRLSDATVSNKTQAFAIYNRSSISANAGGLTQQTFTNQDLLGGVIYDDVVYTVGNVQNNDENDFQISISPLFDPTKVSLISTQVTASTVPGISVGSTDSLYFISGNGSVGASITIRWSFKIIATNFTAYFLPLAGSTSGGTNYKYAINTALGANGTAVTIASGPPTLTIAKSSNKAVYSTCETATFTLTISNTGAYGVSIDSLSDQLPSGFTYVGIEGTSQVAASQLTEGPSTGATGTIKFKGGVTSGSNTSVYIGAGSSVALKYTATAPCTAASNLNTTVAGFIGASQFGTANNAVSVNWGLPVKWGSFNAKAVNGNVELMWSTVGEWQTRDFVVQRSTDGMLWVALGSRTAAGTANGKKEYAYTDTEPEKGQTNYYRLQQRDMNDNSEFSKVVNVWVGEDSRTLQLFPNPVLNGKLNIRLAHPETVSIHNETGRLVFRKSYPAGLHKIEMNNLTKGTYILRTEKQTLSFIVQ